MSLGFATPVLLAGLVGALVPLLVHLLRRRPPRPTPFPALVLLLEPTRQAARRRRLREWLLLLTRMALIATVAATLAGPYCARPVPVPPGAARHQAAVIVLDDTLSMQYERAGRPLWREARRRAQALLRVLPPTAPVALLTVTERGTQVPELSLDRARLRRAVARLAPTYLAADAGEAVRRAVRVLAEAPPGTPRVVYLITDGTRRGLTLAPHEPGPGIALQVLDVAGAPLPNRAVVSLAEVVPTRSGAGAARHFRVQVLSSDSAAGPVRVTLRVAGRDVAHRDLAAPAQGVRAGVIEVSRSAVPAQTPFVQAAVAADALRPDDVRTLAVGRLPHLRILLVDGDPRETRHQDELFFVEAALRALAPRLHLTLSVVAGADLEGATFARADLVVLANVATVSRTTARALRTFVRRGGALLVAMGDQVDPDALNQQLGADLLPARLRSFRSGGAAGPAGATTAVDTQRLAPALREACEDPACRHSLLAARIRRYALLEQVRGEVLMRLETGAPLLVSGARGAGRVLLWTTTLDHDWNDLVLRPVFLPLLRGILAHLTGSADAAAGEIVAGRPATLRALADERLVVVGPAGPPRLLPPAGPDGSVVFLHTDVPGPYRVFTTTPGRAALGRPGLRGRAALASLGPMSPLLGPAAQTGLTGLRERPALAFAVVTDPAESDLRRYDRMPHRPGTLDPSRDGRGPAAALVRDDLIPWFALVCLVLLLCETLLAARFGQWRRRDSRAAR